LLERFDRIEPRAMTFLDSSNPPSLFSRTLRECRDLYLSSAHRCVREHPNLISQSDGDFVQLMDDLHRALVLKIYITVCEADREWSKEERFLAEVLCHHLFDQWISGDALRETMKKASTDSAKLTWYSMLRPFDKLAPLRDKVGELEAIIIRLANAVARADGRLKESERIAIQQIQNEIETRFRNVATDDYRDHGEADRAGDNAIEQMRQEAGRVFIGKPETRSTDRPAKPTLDKTAPVAEAPPQVTVEEALAELEKLIGLDNIKHEVRSLTNLLKLQKLRADANLPTTDVSLHMVFTGNPGTGKTTVARIVGKIFQALGVLSKGHLVETDRSGLVAEYAGQTGPKTNKKIDEALDGILFIDEAYSLIATESEDPYGREAIQALLKRAEDNRDRLVVILAGYPDEMEDLLLSNPGLSSRFNRRMEFLDYTPVELGQIFELMCNKNHFKLTADVRWRILSGFTQLTAHKNRHFGNGRASRNLFEQAIRRLANRIAVDDDITTDDLQLLAGDDIEFRDSPWLVIPAYDDAQSHVLLACPDCKHEKDTAAKVLGKRVKCPKCQHRFTALWGTVVATHTDNNTAN
jgi:SpoVK/Ycf46/Vps4 family AAA+-type ATPase